MCLAVMAGLEPGIYASTADARMAGTRPAMTVKVAIGSFSAAASIQDHAVQPQACSNAAAPFILPALKRRSAI